MEMIKKKYLKDIKTVFPIHGKKEKEHLQELSVHINEYADRFPDASMQMFIDSFGEPKDIVSAYYESVDDEYILKQMKKRKLFRNFVLFLTTLSILLSIYFMTLWYMGYLETKNSMIVSEETIIIEEN